MFSQQQTITSLSTSTQCCSWPPSFQRNSSQQRGHHHTPMDKAGKKTTDELIAQSMAQLSFQERQEQQEHLHGVASCVAEDEEDIKLLLREQDEHLQRLKQDRSALAVAESMNPNYTSDKSFRLMFLRGNRYNPKDAAGQMIRYMDTKQKLFGTNKLNKKITLEDLDEDDRACVENGHFQILPICDRSNRPIIMEFPGLRSFRHLENELRARFYIYMCLLESEAAQLNGIIAIGYSIGEYREKLNGAGFMEHTEQALSLPIHFPGFHLATSDFKHYALMSACFQLVPTTWRVRFRLHMGSHMECQYQLSTYGIPWSGVPVNNNGQVLLENHLCWYKSRFLKDFGHLSESVQLPSKLTALSADLPLANDVVFGRKKFQNEGNRKLRVFVRNMAIKYNECNKASKRLMREHLIKEIRDAGGKFLIVHEDPSNNTIQGFEELDLEDVHGKIAQAFRNHRRPRTMPAKFGSSSSGEQIVRDVLAEPVTPGPNDVLFGRKRNNDGNKRVRKLVSDLATEYNIASKMRKRELATSLVQEIQRTGGRFLRQQEESDYWEEVPDEYARGKIAKHFQNSRRPPAKRPFA